jgi:hypothetical protein
MSITVTSSVDHFKQLAQDRLCEGRLIKRANEYGPDPLKVKAALAQNKLLGAQEDPVKTVVLENLVYIGFDAMLLLLMKSFRAFLEAVEGPYVLVFNNLAQNKSDVWVLLLLLRYGPRFLGAAAYRDPAGILELSKVTFGTPVDADMAYVFCDDVVYSGTQLHYRWDALRTACDKGWRFKPRAHVVCAAIGPRAIARLGTCVGEAQLFYGRRVPSLKETVDAHPDRYDKARVEARVRDLPQPFEDTIDHAQKILLYLEHKMPDILSSFPDILVDVVSNCKQGNAERRHALIRDGSSATTRCAHPFYKIADAEKGAGDCKGEEAFIEGLLTRAPHQPPLAGGGRRRRFPTPASPPKPTPEKTTLPPGLPGVPAPRRPRTVYVGAHGKKYVRVKGAFVHLAGLRRAARVG